MQNLLDTIRRISGGSYCDQAGDELAKIVKAVEETGRQGTLTLNLKISKAAKGGAMVIIGTMSSKPPAGDPMNVVLFADENGRLTDTTPGMDDSKTLFEINSNKPEKIINVGEK